MMLLLCYIGIILVKSSCTFGGDSTAAAHSPSSFMDCPISCYCDDYGKYVSCVGDGYWSFPTEIPNSTLRLELRNYLVSELSSYNFATLVQLEELKLIQSRIETIENDTFAFNVNLDRLYISENALTTISCSMFKSLVNLRYFDLSRNSISVIEEAFTDLANLEQLNLRDNMIPQLTSNSFAGLHKVQYLNLDSNNISFIEVGTFQYLTNLAHLFISDNPLTTLSRLDFFGSRLQFIDISHVGLDSIPQSLTKFVRDLRLGKNNITHVSAGDFDSYPYLGLLVLDDNYISEIENDALGRLEYLMRLWLNGNLLTRIPSNLPPSLLVLYMEKNKLTEIPSYSFKGLNRLEQLFLQRNEIGFIATCAFCDLVSLKNLDLQANKIENLTAGIFHNLTQLETLDLSRNNLKYIDSRGFESLTRVTTLHMSRVHTNVILGDVTFDPLHKLQILELYDSPELALAIVNSTRMLHGLHKVQELNIMHDKIKTLRSDFPSFFPSLKTIKLSGNLWKCDDDIKWLVNWIKQSNVQFYSSYNIRCESPDSLNSKPLMMLNDKDFGTTTEYVSTTDYAALLKSAYSHNYLTTSTETSARFEINVTSFTLKFDNDYTQLSVSTDVLPKTPVALSNSNNPNSHPYQSESIPPPKPFYPGRPSSSVPVTTLQYYHDTSVTDTFTNLHHLTSQEIHTAKSTELPLLDNSAANDSALQVNESTKSIRSSTPQRRVLSSRLQTASRANALPNWTYTNTVVVSTTIAVGTVLLLIVAMTAFTLFRLRHRYEPVQHMRRNSSISYYPQKDEVSIVTLTEGTVGTVTSSHHGLGNKLYYIMENGGRLSESNRDSLQDSQLQELLSNSPTDSGRVY